MTASTTSKELARLEEAHLAQRERLAGLLGTLPKDRLHARPSDGGWTADEVCRHMAVTHALYAARLGPALARREPVGDTAWPRPGFGGRLLLRLLERRDRKLRAPARFRPERAPAGPSGRHALESAWTDYAALLRAARDKPLGPPRFGSPFLGWVIRFAPAEALEILVAHDGRHLDQLERLVRS